MVVRLNTPIETASVGDTEVVSINYTDWLDGTEVLTGTPTIAEQVTSDLTIASSDITLNAAEVTILGQAVAANKAVQFSVVGGTTANTPYLVRVTVSSDGTPARTAVRDAPIPWE